MRSMTHVISKTEMSRSLISAIDEISSMQKRAD